MKAIFLVRHAETTLNASRVVQFPDTPLSSLGRWQAARLAARLHRDGVVHVVSSDYLRARMTAELIRDVTNATLTIDERLRERNLGELRGRPYAQVRQQLFDRNFEPRTGESWSAFNERVDAMWERVQQVGQTVDGPLALVTHGLVCRALVQRHLTVSGAPHPLRFPNASVTVVAAESPWPVQVLASDTHLHSWPRMKRTEDGNDAMVRFDRPGPTRWSPVPQEAPTRAPGAHGSARRRRPAALRRSVPR